MAQRTDTMNIFDGYPNLTVSSVHLLSENVGTEQTPDWKPRQSIVAYTQGGVTKYLKRGLEIQTDGTMPTVEIDGQQVPTVFEVSASPDWAKTQEVLRRLPSMLDLDKCVLVQRKSGESVAPPARAICVPGLQVAGADVGLSISVAQATQAALQNAAHACLAAGYQIAAREPAALLVTGENAPNVVVAADSESDAWLEVWSLPSTWKLEQVQ